MMYICEEALPEYVCVYMCVNPPQGACAEGSSRNKRGCGGCDPSPSIPQQEVMERGGGSHYREREHQGLKRGKHKVERIAEAENQVKKIKEQKRCEEARE